MHATLLGCVLLAACNFDPGFVLGDARIIDTMTLVDGTDGPPSMPASCKMIHATTPAAPSGMYTIDPDGAGTDAPISATCDMTTDGGGWTMVFVAPSTNLNTAIPYTTSTPRLLADAQDALLSYRNASLVVAPNYASFSLPSQWRTNTPFSYAEVDVSVNVSVNGGVPTAATLRFGSDSFGNNCTDPWSVTGSFGRICILGTAGPFYDGFSNSFSDYCNDSLNSWNSTACTSNLQFAIAVR